MTVKLSLTEVVKAGSPVMMLQAARKDQGSDMNKEVRDNGQEKLLFSQRNVKANPSAVISRRNGCRVSIIQRVKSADYVESRFAKDTTVEEVKGYMKDVFGTRNVNVNCRKLKTKFDTYSSYHVKVTGEEEGVRDVRCLLDGEDG